MSDKKIKVVQVNALEKTMSTGRTTWEMHEYFLNNGIESYIAVATEAKEPDTYVISNKKARRWSPCFMCIFTYGILYPSKY